MGIGLKKPENVAGSAAPAILIGLFVAFGGVLFGYALGSLPLPLPLLLSLSLGVSRSSRLGLLARVREWGWAAVSSKLVSTRTDRVVMVQI